MSVALTLKQNSFLILAYFRSFMGRETKQDKRAANYASLVTSVLPEYKDDYTRIICLESFYPYAEFFTNFTSLLC